ncbi:TasA family protein [Thermococcus sp. 5-4]|uniref:TasA family protein n=1 Tax=Thermococcus sp. 5-4 TaxID=2008440 RepID=UPI000B49B69F|nr:TasA family protein [Thermococcus sp. 5-4]ASA78532.1 hypothetical protein CDI07_09550 [Thermococcus sp. 5-4]
MKMLASLVLVGIVLFGIGAGTWAYFSDTETSSGNYIAAGTLDLKFSWDKNTWFDNESVPGDIEVKDVYPGWSKTVTGYAKNFGSITGDLYMKVTYTEGGGTNPEPEGTPDEAVLDDNLNITITVNGTSVTKTLKEWADEGYYKLYDNLGPGDWLEATVTAYIPDDVGNEIQGDWVNITVEFVLIQDGYSP